MNILKVDDCDLINVIGDGVAVSIWVSGCDNHCVGCHNQESWNYNSGVYYDSVLPEIIKAISNKYITQVSFLGGDPLSNRNMLYTKILAKMIKKIKPDIQINVWTGRNMSEFNKTDIYTYDYIIDGKFIKELKESNTKKYCGSSNQLLWNRNELGDWEVCRV